MYLPVALLRLSPCYCTVFSWEVVKLIVVSNIEFKKVRASRHKGRWFAVSKNGRYFLKIQDLSVPIRQIHNLQQVDEIMRDLLSRNAQCVPMVFDSGMLSKNVKYKKNFPSKSTSLFFQITEYIPHLKLYKYSDLFFSLLELASLEIFPNDLKKNNLGWKDDKLFFLDYDQAIKLNSSISGITARETLTYLNSIQLGTLNFSIPGISNLDKLIYQGTEKLDLSKIVRFKKQKSTRNKFNNYHLINTSKLFAQGTRDIKQRAKILDEMDCLPRTRFLDVGANLGLLSRYFENRGGYVESTEIDTPTRSLGQSISIIEGSKVKFIGEIPQDSIPNYDVVLLFSVLHHISDYVSFAKTLDLISKRVLIECRLVESGKLILGRWRWHKTNSWSFESIEDLKLHLLQVFPRKKFITILGESDKGRFIFELSDSG